MVVTTLIAAQDLRTLFDILYENRKLSIANGYFSYSDVELLTKDVTFSSPLITLLDKGCSLGLFRRIQVFPAEQFSFPIYVYAYNPNVLTANPTNINFFKGTCPPIPPCLLRNGAGPYNMYQGNGMLAVRDNQRSGVFSPGTRFAGEGQFLTPEYRFYAPLDFDTTCSCLDSGKLVATKVPPVMASPCEDAATCASELFATQLAGPVPSCSGGDLYGP